MHFLLVSFLWRALAIIAYREVGQLKSFAWPASSQ